MSADRSFLSPLLGLWCLAASAQQGFYREYYAGIAGGAIANLTAAAAFPDSPTSEEIINNVLETGTNIGDYYGQRLRAVLTPPVSGAYRFWIASDDNGELWLGTNAFPSSRQRIAYVPSYTGARVWTASVYQCSSPIALTAGTRYYIEALQKENSGGDNLAVAWLVPGSGATNVIPASAIQPYLETPAIKIQPASVDIDEQWAGTRNVSFTVEAARKAGIAYQWQRDGADIPGATQSVYTLFADLANSNRLFRCRLASLGGAVTSQTARYVLVPDNVPPALGGWRISHDRRMLTLAFSEPLLAASISNAAFAVSGTAVVGATLQSNATNVILRLADPLSAGTAYALSLKISDCATPANVLALASVPITPDAWAATPAALIRGGVEPPGPSSRRGPLAVTEINHTPAARADGRDLRFIELYNSNPYFQDIGNYRFSGAFDYTVPSGTVMAANSYLVIAPSPADLAAVYGIANVLGGFDAYAFDGSSEITLKDEMGAWLTTVAYADEPPWPVAADGSGHSLVLARPSYGEREADGWAASARLGGSPGTAEPARPTGYEAVLFNEVLAHSGATPGFVELHNLSSSPVALAGCALKHGIPAVADFVFPEGTTLPPNGFLAFDESALGFKIDGAGDTLWLFAPESAGGAAIDVIRLDDQEIATAYGRYPDGDGAWNRLEAPTPATVNAPRQAAEVVLNEIMYHPISESKDEEYIELFNPGTNAVALAGWKIGGGIDYTFSAQTIPAKGYLIVPRDRDTLAALYPAQAALMTPDEFSGSLANSRDTVTLSKPVPVFDTQDPLSPVIVTNNTVVERVVYRAGGEWGNLADGGGSSLERVDPRSDPSLARSWADSDETRKSGWTTVAFTGKIDNGFSGSSNGDPNAVNVGLMDGGECLVDAVEVKAAGGANLVNNPSFEADSSDWRFMGTHEPSSMETDASAPDGSRVLHLRAGDRCHNSMNICRGMLSATMAKSGTGTISVRARWLSGCPELLVRTRGSWLEACGNILTTRALGTPGQVNSRAASNGAPALYDVIHQPVLPRNGEKVTVYARAQDPDGVSSVTLHYRVEGQDGTNAVPMIPAAGGYYAGEIPAGLPNNALAAFFVEAADGHAQTASARFPAAAPARECLVRYNEPLDSRAFGIYRFWVTKENLAYWAAREKGSNKPVDVTFVYGTNRVFYQAGVMYAGSPFHTQGYSSPINANVDYESVFQSDDTLLDDDGVVLSTIGNLGSDTIAVREQFCYSLVHALKIPHMYRRYIHLYANGVEQNSKKIYEDTEKPNAGAIKHWFPEDPDNDFFKVDDWFEHTLDLSDKQIVTARLQKYTTTNAENNVELKLGRYRWNWLKRGYETFRANDYTNFFDLVETLNIADADTYAQRIQEKINIADFVPVIAANQFIGNFDSYGFTRGKNMYLYDSADGWQLIAWDLDYNFGMSRVLDDPINPALASFVTEDPTMRTFLKTPLVCRVFMRAMQTLAAAANDPAILAWTRAKYDALKGDGTNLAGSYDDFFKIVDTRRTSVVAQLAAANPAAFTVTAPAEPLAEAVSNVVSISGVAPFGVTSLRVNGAETAVAWTSPTSWTAQVVLNNGTNAFQIEAYTADGTPLPGGSVTRHIAYTGTPLDPLEQFLCISEIMSKPVTNTAAYIEIANRSSSTLMNLTRLYLDGAVSFTFPNGTMLRPGEHRLIVADTNAISAAYGTGAASRVIGAYNGTLPAAGTLRLRRPAVGFEPDDPVLDAVVYEDAAPWPAAAPDGSALQLINPARDNNRVANWAVGTTGGATITATPVPWGQTWKYFVGGYPGDTWAATGFDDSAWASGPGPLGKETATLAIPLATSISLTNGRMAYYFRTTFNYTGNPANATLQLAYMLDDAAAFYLNGEEIHRSSLMPPGDISDTTPATTAKAPEGVIEGPFVLPATALRAGVNTLAVRVHQNQNASSDLVFGMKLDAASTVNDACTPGATNASDVTLSSLPGVWLNEVQTRNLAGAFDNAGEREPWCELYNGETGAVALAGWTLATATDDPGWAFPTGAVIAARAFLRVWLDAEPAESTAGDLHAGFRFDAASGMLLLRAPIDGRDVAVDYLRFAGSATNAAWGAYPDGTSNPRRWLHPATPAAANRIDRPACRIVINEFMAQNDLFTNPLNGKKDDWLELFNDGAETVDLGGFVVTDTLTGENPPVPDLRNTKSLVISNGVTLVPGQALRIWTGASKSTTLPFDPANIQAPFGLGKDGDQICLFNPALELVDRVQYATEQSAQSSLGRWFNGAAGELVTFGQPTPGLPNRNPRFASATVVQPAAFAFREESPFAYTNRYASGRPDHFVFRLYATDGLTVPTNLTFDTDAGALTWTPSEAQGPAVYPLRVCGFLADGLSVCGCDEVLLTLRVLEAPSRPVIGAVTNLVIDEGALAAFTVTVTRAAEIPPYATATRLRLSGPLPTNATLNADTGAFTWQTGEPDGPGSHLITVIAEDADDPTASAVTNVTVTVNEVNSAFTYASPTVFYLWREEPFAAHLRFSDPDLPPNVFSHALLSGPSGLTLDPDTAWVQWRPTAEQTGSFTMRVRSFDNAGAARTTTVTLSVDTFPLAASALAAATAGGGLNLQWKSKRDAFYTIEWTPSLAAPAWRPVNPGAPIAGTGGTLSYPLDPAVFGSSSNGFFRILQTRE